jgi:hypothetical protein
MARMLMLMTPRTMMGTYSNRKMTCCMGIVNAREGKWLWLNEMILAYLYESQMNKCENAGSFAMYNAGRNAGCVIVMDAGCCAGNHAGNHAGKNAG